MNVLGLGYVGIGAPDPQEWLKFGTEILGMMPARAVAGEDWGMPATPGQGPASDGSGVAPDGSVYLKMDDQQYRIAVHPNEQNKGIMYIGLEIEGGAAELEAAVTELNAAGYPAQMASEQEARARSVTGLATTRDPSGNGVELFFGPARDFKFASPLGANFVTGTQGLGHMNLFVPDLDKSKEFYSRVLGFKLSDYMRFGPAFSANFYHCNARHHTLGLTHLGDVNGIHHLMVQMDNIDQVGQCMDRVQAAGIEIVSTLGRHINDHMLSFYVRSPFGFEVEIGCDGLLVDENWTPFEFVEGDIWGHKGLDPETILESAANISK